MESRKIYSDRSIKIVSQESKASEVSIDDFKRIVDNHQYEKLTFDDGKVLIDAFVASAIVQLYDQLDDAQKQQFDGIVRTSTGVDKLLSIALKQVNQKQMKDILVINVEGYLMIHKVKPNIHTMTMNGIKAKEIQWMLDLMLLIGQRDILIDHMVHMALLNQKQVNLI